MATLANNKPGLIDLFTRLNPDGNLDQIAELLEQDNAILSRLSWIEANAIFGHKATIRTGIPAGQFRKMYRGFQPEKSTTVQVIDATAMFGSRAEIDVKQARASGSVDDYRFSENVAFIEGLGQTFCLTLIYGDTTVNPERFHGLSPRYSALTGAGNSMNVLSAGGSGSDNTSMWLVFFGDQKITGLYPRGSKGGLSHEDLGILDSFDDQTPSGRFRAYHDLYEWDCGLHVKDWRWAVRICNIDVSDLAAQTGTQALTAATHLFKMMIKAKHRIPNKTTAGGAFYCNRTVRQYLDIHAMDKSQNVLSIQGAAEQLSTSFLGIPIETVDQILNTEAAVA